MGVVGKTLRFTLGLTLGAGIGAVGALLLAPQPGKDTKELIQSRMDAIMQAGKTAQREREQELLEYWQQTSEINQRADNDKDDKKDKK